MIWMYAICVCGGEETNVCAALKKENIKCHLPRTTIAERKGGAWHKKEKLLIPGYIFIESILTPEIYYKVKEMAHVRGWVGKGQPSPMTNEDAEFILQMANNGEAIPMLTFDSPYLKKAIIRSVDKRHFRIKATIMVMEKTHTVTFGYLG